jgi:hypothetical protein
MHFGFGAEAEEVMNRDWAPSASSSLPATAPDGGGMLFRTGTLYLTFLIAMYCSLKFFARRYLFAIA